MGFVELGNQMEDNLIFGDWIDCVQNTGSVMYVYVLIVARGGRKERGV